MSSEYPKKKCQFCGEVSEEIGGVLACGGYSEQEKLDPKLIEFWGQAEKYCLDNFGKEVDTVEKRFFVASNAPSFFFEYVFVVLNSGMKNQIAEKIYHHFLEEYNPNVIGHPMKRDAVRLALTQYPKWFEALREAKDKVAYLDTLPMIGPITKYHLARNLGIDCAKPDRHLVRLAEKFGFKDVQVMCEALANHSGWRVGTVDVILWRYCNMQGQTAIG